MTCAATRGVTSALGQIAFLFEKPGLGLEETLEVLKYNWANNGSALNKMEDSKFCWIDIDLGNFEEF